ncbi:myb/SANT-like DNA-binding domain-containing protein 3 [Mya arenaria]|uniref:myb/SANT-like DNA-binding domain-containing protein 3 n=1 Tax=Mya arenaria TaxID=6604 RepID=UPI0022E63952|nr:myb/SANT-like DNA-binding domain-containing protein 3 [Mya arenaria]
MNKRIFYTEREISLLKELVTKRVCVIENKKTDFKSIQEKNRAWLDVSKEFNAFPYVYRRNEKQLKKCWQNLKERSKRREETERHERELAYKGRENDPIFVDETDDKSSLASLIVKQNEMGAGGFDGSENRMEDTDEHIPTVAERLHHCRHSSSGPAEDGGSTSFGYNIEMEHQIREHSARMDLMAAQLRHAREEHELKMEVLALKKAVLEAEVHKYGGVLRTMDAT